MSLSNARHGVNFLVHPTFRGDPGRMRRSARSARPRLSSDFSQQLHHRAGIPHLGLQQHGRRELETLLGGQAACLLLVSRPPPPQWLLCPEQRPPASDVRMLISLRAETAPSASRMSW
jgi:hypothetical protein